MTEVAFAMVFRIDFFFFFTFFNMAASLLLAVEFVLPVFRSVSGVFRMM